MKIWNNDTPGKTYFMFSLYQMIWPSMQQKCHKPEFLSQKFLNFYDIWMHPIKTSDMKPHKGPDHLFSVSINNQNFCRKNYLYLGCIWAQNDFRQAMVILMDLFNYFDNALFIICKSIIRADDMAQSLWKLLQL